MELLQAEGLEKRIGHRLILDGISLQVSAGSCVALIGHNGAGKSTLVKVLAGLSRPTAGRFWLNGQDPMDDPGVRALVGVALHESMLYGDLTAKENLLFYGRLFGLPNPGARADALLQAFGLALYAGEYVRTFSRGMTQRLSLARAMMHNPKVLLLDEVFAGLDLAGISLAVNAVLAARTRGTAVVLVTHELAVAKQLATQVVYLAGGRVALMAPAGDAVWKDVAARLEEGGAVR